MFNPHLNLTIIGGGITGSYAAYLASQKKLKVEVFERASRQEWFRDPLVSRRCGEGIWQKKLNDAGIKISLNSAPSWVENFTKTLLLGHYRQGNLKFMKGKISPYLFINRGKFENDFYQEATQKRITWHFGEEIRDFSEWKRKNKFDLIIGAWGTAPGLTNQVTMAAYKQEFVLACQYTLAGIDSRKIENAKTLVLADDPNIRYFYIFPKGKSGEANIGVVFNYLSVKNPFSHLDEFIGLSPLGKARLLPERTFAKIIDAGPPIKREMLLDNSLLLIGDAGFTTDAVSGGGIGYGLLAAKEAIESCFAQNPQAEFYERLNSLTHDLDKSYQLSQKLYPQNIGEKKRVNARFFAAVQGVIRARGVLSLGRITEAVFKV